MSDTLNEKAVLLVKKITEHMHIPCEVSAGPTSDEVAGPLLVSIETPEHAKILIGKDGQNLKALEHVVRAILTRQDPAGHAVVVDVNEYRQTKTKQLIDVVKQTAGRVRDTQRSEALPPMTSYERRIVHTELASWSDVATESVGQEPQRRVVIKPL